MQSEMIAHKENKPDRPVKLNYVKFLTMSFLGIFLFIIPVPYQGAFTIPIAIVANWFSSIIAPILLEFVLFYVVLSALVTIVHKLKPFSFINENRFLSNIFNLNAFWFMMRLLGAAFVIFAYFQIGPQFIWDPNTGGLMFNDLLPILTYWFFLCLVALPLLINFGAMEFFGVLIRVFMKPLFTLPGRSSLDALASFIGNGPVGIIITSKQYDEGYYTGREAAVIATCFSIVSIAFCLVVAQVVGIDHVFIPYYFTIIIASLVAAIILPRIPPLSRIKDDYRPEVGKQIQEEIPSDMSRFRWALTVGAEKATKATNYGAMMKSVLKDIFEIFMNIIPVVMAIGTIALVTVEYTPILNYISYPFYFLLELFQIPEADGLAPIMIAGFFDQFLPAILGANLESDIARFIAAGVAVTPLVYLSETVVIILKSRIPLGFWGLVAIYFQRLIITLPIVIIMAYVIF